MLFGAHQSIAGGVFNAVYRGQQATCDVIQIFNKSNNQWRAKRLSDEDVERYYAAIEETGIRVVCSHTSYLINLASPDTALRDRSFKSLVEEVQRCERLEIPNLVMHPGSHVGSGEEVGLGTIIEALNRLFERLPDTRVTICLEATAGQGTNLGSTFEQLAYIIDGVDNKARIGVCLDSCHIFAAGYPLVRPKDYRRTMRRFDEIIGMDRLHVFHLNDSLREFDSGRDRHEHIGKGHIGLEGFSNIVNDRRLRYVPMILETPKGEDFADDVRNLRILRGLVGKGA